MDIPNLNPQPSINRTNTQPLSKPTIIILVFLAISIGFWASRFSKNNTISTNNNSNSVIISSDSLTDTSQVQPNKLYGNLSKAFTDSATGTLEKGSINGEGTHILNRPGGVTQRAALTSSVIDLDLFVGKNVEIKGQTNASTKTSWLIDVGTIKIVE